MKRTNLFLSSAVAMMVLSAALEASAQTLSLSTKWNSPSTLTPTQAADVLAREASGQTVSPSQLFEARKHLRSDRSVSFGGPVMTSVLQKLVAGRFDSDVRIRILPIVMQWLESKSGTDSNGKETLRLRGETVGLIALNADPNLAATMMAHYTIYEEWRWCSTSLCVNPAVGPVHSGVGYELTVPLDSTAPAEARSSEIILASGFAGSVFSQIVPAVDPSRYLGVACDPLPSSTSVRDGSPSTMTFTHLAENTQHMRTNRILCGFFALADGPNSLFTYRVGGAVAQPPASAATSAVVNNPLEFDLFQ